jgi:uncharacterized membrane protein
MLRQTWPASPGTVDTYPMPPDEKFVPDPVLERNIATLVERRRRQDRQRPLEERLAAAIARFTGSMISVYVHLLIFGAWIVVNLGWTPLQPFDSSFVALAMIASVEAIFLTTFVLMTQNRMSLENQRQAELDLHISLLAEHEITTLSKLVREMAAKLGIDATGINEIEPLTRDVAPEQVLDRIEAAQEGEHAS